MVQKDQDGELDASLLLLRAPRIRFSGRQSFAFGSQLVARDPDGLVSAD